MAKSKLTYQELILRLQNFWAERGCVLQQPYDLEVGAGTMAPETFLRVLGPKEYKVAYLQPSRRPADGRYGENPNRLYKHTQLQVILKPPPQDVQELYLKSLEAIGIDLREHDIKFEEDNWESPTLGAWGIGWQVMLDGLEITQFTYFQQCGGVDLDPISVELTYGLERIAAFLQDVDSIYDIVWARDPQDLSKVFTYGDVRLADELQMSVYSFDLADVEAVWKHFSLFETECRQLVMPSWSCAFTNSIATWYWDCFMFSHQGVRVPVAQGRLEVSGLSQSTSYFFYPVIDTDRGCLSWIDGDVGTPKIAHTAQITNDDLPGHLVPLGPIHITTSKDPGTSGGTGGRLPHMPLPYPGLELCLKCSHLFNILDARGAISVTERVGIIARIRALALNVALEWLAHESAKAKKAESEPEAVALSSSGYR